MGGNLLRTSAFQPGEMGGALILCDYQRPFDRRGEETSGYSTRTRPPRTMGEFGGPALSRWGHVGYHEKTKKDRRRRISWEPPRINLVPLPLQNYDRAI